jgi:hypothetical protein
MKRIDFRTLLGGGLILLGGLMILEKLGLPFHASGVFWGLILLVGAGYFLQIFSRNPRGVWWAVIPGMTLAGMGLGAILPAALEGWGGALFLGAIGLSFWIIYFTDRSRWWGIIPGGVLFTLALVSVLDESFSGLATGSVFFIGLGLTFLLVALLPNPFGKMQWAYIPAAVLVVMGAFLGSASTVGLANYIWPAALIVIGLVVIFGFFFNREKEE